MNWNIVIVLMAVATIAVLLWFGFTVNDVKQVCIEASRSCVNQTNLTGVIQWNP